MKSCAYLIVHGFCGDTGEIDYLYRFLLEKGLNAQTVLLSGHGGTKKDLSQSAPTDWIKSVETKIDELSSEYESLILIGFSMGGLICGHFANLPQVKRMVFINTPVYFWNIKVILGDIFRGIKDKNNEKIDYYKESLFGATPKSGIDFLKLLYTSKKLFENIKVPLLVLQCKNDESVRYKSAQYIKEHAGGDTKVILYEGGCHQIFAKSPNLRDKACEDIYEWSVEKCN